MNQIFVQTCSKRSASWTINIPRLSRGHYEQCCSWLLWLVF